LARRLTCSLWAHVSICVGPLEAGHDPRASSKRTSTQAFARCRCRNSRGSGRALSVRSLAADRRELAKHLVAISGALRHDDPLGGALRGSSANCTATIRRDSARRHHMSARHCPSARARWSYQMATDRRRSADDIACWAA
jgi:hypothetical protein